MWLSIHCRLSFVYIIFRERDIKTKTQLEDFMITITILFFDNNKNKYLILVQMQVTVMNHNGELSGGGWNVIGKEKREERAPQLTLSRWE